MQYYKITTNVVNSESGGETPPVEGLKIYAHRTSSSSSYALVVNGTKTMSTSNDYFYLRADDIPDGWEFVKWVCESDRDATFTDNPTKSSWKPSNNPGTSSGSATKCTVTLQLKKTVIYTLSYDANGGTGAPEPESSTTGVFEVSDVIPQYDDYTFLGWSLDNQATSAQYNAGDSITITEDTTLYAVWYGVEPPPPPPPPHSGYLTRNASGMLLFGSSGYLVYD